MNCRILHPKMKRDKKNENLIKLDPANEKDLHRAQQRTIQKWKTTKRIMGYY